jgi:hypothetical protein
MVEQQGVFYIQNGLEATHFFAIVLILIWFLMDMKMPIMTVITVDTTNQQNTIIA